jgi:type IV pilus assembly protein PilO
MAMTLNDLRRLDPKKIGSWPILPKVGVLFIILVLIILGGYWFDWKAQIERIDQEKLREEGLRKTFLTKKSEAINLPAYQKQLEDIERQFGALLKQLPGKSEMDALLTDINQAGLGRGLQFELFKPAVQETRRDFYAELPITIKVSGNYHDIGAFASDIGKLSRIVTLENIALAPAGKGGGLALDATAKTFRYLDDEELAQQRRRIVCRGFVPRARLVQRRAALGPAAVRQGLGQHAARSHPAAAGGQAVRAGRIFGVRPPRSVHTAQDRGAQGRAERNGPPAAC